MSEEQSFQVGKKKSKKSDSEHQSAYTNFQKYATHDPKEIRKATISPENKKDLETMRSSMLSEVGGMTLGQIRRNRQMVESDVSKLHNRIKMLQMEEEKALKKIDETRKKAKQIIDARLANEKKARYREEEEEIKRRQLQELHFERKQELRRSIQVRQEQVMRQKASEVQMIKKEKKDSKKK